MSLELNINNQVLLNHALSQYGVEEIPGSRHNPTIVQYSKDIGYSGIINDETAWCSIFANWCAQKAGLESSGKLNARSWLKVGEVVEQPQAGDVVIFWRSSPKSWKGHVGFYINESRTHIYCLGGNQQNRVCILAYDKSRLLGYRRLRQEQINSSIEKQAA